MNRVIKFRAWNGEEMLEAGEIHLTEIAGKTTCKMWDGGKYDYYVLMQYTGLKDKNGKEIYEGDVLRSRENDEVYRVGNIIPLHRHTHITNIGYFSGKTYHSRVASAAYDNLDDWMSWPEMYEIIGNIYENPELLTPIK